MTTPPPHFRPVTDLQKTILLASLEPGPEPLYIQQRVLAVSASGEELRTAWNDLVLHHSILRAQFSIQGSTIRQFHLNTWTDAFAHSTAADSTEARAIYDREYSTAFEFDCPHPLWRLHFVETPEQTALCITVHHITIDDRTFSLLLHQLNDRLAGKPLPPTAQFHDYLDWLQAQDFSHLKRPWKEYAAPLSETTLLPENDDPSGPAIRLPVSLAAPDRLRRFAADNELTPNTIMLGAWAFVLSRLTFQEPICFGAVRAGTANTIPGSKTLAGPLLKTLPFIQPVPNAQTTLEYLQDVRKRWKFLYGIDHCSLDNLLDWAGIDTPPFTTLLNYVKPSGPPTLLARRNRVSVPTLGIADNGKTFTIELITPARHESICRAAAKALPQVIEQFIGSDQPLENIELCPNETAGRLKHSQGPTENFPEQTLAALIEQALSRFAEHTALGGTYQKTYSELDHDSRALAARLTDLPAGARIAIALPAGPQCTTAILAAARTGRPFICLNPDSPPADLQQVLDLVDPACVITRPQTTISSNWNVLQFPKTLPDGPQTITAPVTPHDLAYLVHTSGSTGTPKVIQIEQHSTANLIQSMLPVYGLKPGDRRTQLAQPGPDFFIAETLITLCGGATLVFNNCSTTLSTREFFEELRTSSITITSLSSSYWRELVSGLSENTSVIPPSLRMVIVGMETVDPDMLRTWTRLAPRHIKLLNVYGPSETTMIATVADLSSGLPDGETQVPIGRPISNTAAYIMDRAGRLMPPEAAGEICIAGAGVMRGYTAQPHPLPANPQDTRPDFARLYRTGDFGRFNANGELVFIGRRDNQVKIRGHRIELGTVELHLSRAAGGAQSVALAVPRARRHILTGFIEADHPVDTEALRTALRETVKEAFIPSVIHALPAFPRLPNGKMDRQALFKEATRQQTDSPESHQTDDPQLNKLITCWNRALDTTGSAPDSNFFDMGGTSIDAMALFADIEKELHALLPISTLITHPTPRLLLGQIQQAPPEFETVTAFKKSGTNQPIFLLHDIHGESLAFRHFSSNISPDHPVYTLQSPLLNGRYSPRTSVEEMAGYQIKKMRSVQPNGPYALGGYSFGGIIALAMAQQLVRDGHDVSHIFILDSKASGNLRKPRPKRRLKRRIKRFLKKVGRQQRRSFLRNTQGWLFHTRLRLGLELRPGLLRQYISWHHWHAAKAYVPQPLPVDITLICTEGKADKKIAGWKKCTTKNLIIHRLPGDHDALFRLPNARTAADIVNNSLA